MPPHIRVSKVQALRDCAFRLNLQTSPCNSRVTSERRDFPVYVSLGFQKCKPARHRMDCVRLFSACSHTSPHHAKPTQAASTRRRSRGNGIASVHPRTGLPGQAWCRGDFSNLRGASAQSRLGVGRGLGVALPGQASGLPLVSERPPSLPSGFQTPPHIRASEFQALRAISERAL